MNGLRFFLQAFRADRYRGRANRILARVDRMLTKARRLKDQAAQLDAERLAGWTANRSQDGPI